MFSFSWVSEILSIANIREEKFPCLTYWGEKSPHGGFVHLVSLPKAKTNKKNQNKTKTDPLSDQTLFDVSPLFNSTFSPKKI